MNFHNYFHVYPASNINIFFNYKALVILCLANYMHGIIIAYYFIRNNKKKGSLK